MAEILIVDDDARLGELLALLLERAGHRLRRVTSFAQARVELRARRPDLLLSDLDLGRERADEELPRLAAEGLLPPTLVVSGYLDAELAQRLERLPGVAGCVRKPFDCAELERRIGEVLARAPACAADPAAPGADGLQAEAGWADVLPAAGG